MGDEPARILFDCEYCDQRTSALEPTKLFNALLPDSPHDWWMLVCTNSDCGVKEPIEGEDFLTLCASLLDCTHAEAVMLTLRAIYLSTQESVYRPQDSDAYSPDTEGEE